MEAVELKRLASMVEHTNLKVDATEKDIETLCKEAAECGFAGVCVRPNMVKTAVRMLAGSDLYVASVVGFPNKKHDCAFSMATELADCTMNNRIVQAQSALDNGATGIDMVMNLAEFMGGRYGSVENEMRHIAAAAARAGRQKGHALHSKAIIETGFLESSMAIALAAKLAECAEMDYVKTSTGYGKRGASLQDMTILSDVLMPRTGIKASGGIADFASAGGLYGASQSHKWHPFIIGSSKLAEDYRRIIAGEHPAAKKEGY